MSNHEIQACVDAIAISTEIEVELEWDPIALASAETQRQLWHRRMGSSSATRYLHKGDVPDLPDQADPAYPRALRARIAALNQAVWVGCRFTYKTRYGDVTEEAWVRNTAHAGVSPWRLAENIAQLLAGRRALTLADEAATTGGS